MDILIVTTIGAICVFLFCLFLTRVVKFSHAQSASIVSLISLVVIVPYAIAKPLSGDIFALYVCTALLVTFGFYFIGKGGIKALSGGDGKRMHWAPITVAGFFLVLMVVDGSFVAMAINGWSYKRTNHEDVEIDVFTGFPGEVPNAYHKKEAYYNAHQKKMAEQHLRGWHVDIGFDRLPIHQDQDNFIIVSAFDKKMAPINDADVIVKFSRPGEQEVNKEITLQATTQPGIYEALVNFERRGPWRTELYITKNNETYESVLHDSKGLVVQCPIGEECYQPTKRIH